MLRNKFARRLRAESLEKRLMMDGNVSVTRDGAKLIISGDNATNIVDISGTATPGEVTVDGVVNINQVNPALADTTVNGGAQGVLFTGITSIQINLNGGDDDANINNLVTGPLTINDGAGNNTYDLGGWRDGSFTNFDPLFPTGSVLVRGILLVNVSGGSNNVLMNAVGVTSLEQVFAVGTSSTVQIYLSSCASNASIVTGNGNDVVGFGTTYIAGALSVATQGGADLISAVGLRQGGDQTFLTGDGNDTVAFNAYQTNPGRPGTQARLDTGAGADAVTVVNSVFDKVFATLGDGNDSLTVSGTKANSGTLDGQGGNDTFTNGGGNTLGGVVITGF